MSLSEIENFKSEFRGRRGSAFLNAAGMCPISKRVAIRLSACITEISQLGSGVDAEWVPQILSARKTLAQFLDANLSEVALAQNCALALSQAALGFPLKEGDQVVTLDQEYASNYYPWKIACERSGAKLITVQSEKNQQVSLDKLLAAIVPGVKLVSVSWVQFQTGSLVDLRILGEHCHSVGAYLIVDAIQGLGQLPFSFRELPIDFVAGGSHKWLASVNGQGFFAVKAELREKLRPIAVGSGTFNRFGTFADPASPMEKSARKFEPGGLSYLSLFALKEAMELQLEVGLPAIAEEITRLSSRLREGILQKPNLKLVTPINQGGGITSFEMPMEAEAKFLRRCEEEEIFLVKRGPYVRASVHAFVRDDEIERMLALL